jgi:hypothetical protein
MYITIHLNLHVNIIICHWRGPQRLLSLIKNMQLCKKRNCREINIYMYKNIIIIHLILHVDKSLPLKWTAEIVPNKIYVTAKKKGIAEKWLSTCIETKNLILHNSLPLTWTAEMVPDKKYLLYQKKGELCHWRGLQSLSLIKKCDCQKKELQRNKHLHV